MSILAKMVVDAAFGAVAGFVAGHIGDPNTLMSILAVAILGVFLVADFFVAMIDGRTTS